MNSHSLGIAAALAAGLLTGCGTSNDGVRNVSDVSLVTAYYVTCDSVLLLYHCEGPTHRARAQPFTVIISRQAVLQQSFHSLHSCEVLEPREWTCLDEQNNFVRMRGFTIEWTLNDAPPKQASVSPREYCETPMLNPVTHKTTVPGKTDVWRCMW